MLQDLSCPSVRMQSRALCLSSGEPGSLRCIWSVGLRTRCFAGGQPNSEEQNDYQMG